MSRHEAKEKYECNEYSDLSSGAMNAQRSSSDMRLRRNIEIRRNIEKENRLWKSGTTGGFLREERGYGGP